MKMKKLPFACAVTQDLDPMKLRELDQFYQKVDIQYKAFMEEYACESATTTRLHALHYICGIPVSNL